MIPLSQRAIAGFSPALRQEAPEIVSAIPGAAGLGISIVPRSTSQIMADGVSFVPIKGDMPRVGICLAHREHDRSPRQILWPSPADQSGRFLANRGAGPRSLYRPDTRTS